MSWPYPVLVDPRIGSGDLLRPLLALGVQARHEHLDFGDAALVGRGPEDRPISIGVEIKTVGDLLRVITDNRFVGHQLPGLLNTYEQRYLLVEGITSANAARELMVMKESEGRYMRPKYEWSQPPGGWQRPWRYEDVESWRFSMERIGMRRADTADRRGTAAWLAALWRNTSKPWEEHKSHLGVYLRDDLHDLADNPLEQYTVTKKMRVAMALAGKGIGRVKAEAAARYFPTIRTMVNAEAKEWQEVEGFGPKLSRAIVAAVDEKEER